MRLLVRMRDPRESNPRGRNRWTRRYSPDKFVTFETTVTKLIRIDSVSTIRAHGFMPERYRHLTLDYYFNADGTYTFDVWINHNGKTLDAFLASGLLEMDIQAAA